MSGSFSFLPPAASVAAGRTDLLFFALLAFSGLMVLIFIGLIAWFSFHYRRGSNADRHDAPTQAPRLERTWTIVPILVFLGLFFWAASIFADLHRPPANALPVFVVAKQWVWKVEHSNGRREINELHVPLGQPVRLLMTAQDVIHSFSVPAFRIKQDVVPGRYTALWFEASKEGEYHLFCAEYCGTDHALMTGRIIVMRPERYAQWLAQGNTQPGISERGFALFRQHGCIGCHSPESTVHAPDLRGLLGRTVHLQNGQSLIADETYIYDSILEPQKQLVAGFDAIMPSFKGQFNEEDIMAIIEYLRSTTTDKPLDPHQP